MCPLPILLVEHDDLLREWVAACLERCGYPVFPAATPHAALDWVQSGAERPALLLVDLFLPQINGLMLLASLRQTPGLENVPAIMLSTLGFPEIVKQAIAAGAQDFLLKPFDPQVLLDKVNGVAAAGAAHVNG